MLISELAKAVHENAVAHGWWEDEREAPEILALIHSEWSEALEEARADRPLVWYDGKKCMGYVDHQLCEPYIAFGVCHGQHSAAEHPTGGCPKNMKPEGVAVELIDGCIRILDYIGKLDVLDAGSKETDIDIELMYNHDASKYFEKAENLPMLIAYLHLHTAEALKFKDDCPTAIAVQLLLAMTYALSWVKKQGLDPLAILLEKHEYNKTRPYKHGKKF